VDDSSNTMGLFSDTTRQEVRPEVNLVLSAILQLEKKPAAKLLLGQCNGKTGLAMKVDVSSTLVVLFSHAMQREVKPDTLNVLRVFWTLDALTRRLDGPCDVQSGPFRSHAPDSDGFRFLVQIRVFSHDIVEAAEVSSGLTKFGEYELHDLVALE
jgi:hypothetical protein